MHSRFGQHGPEPPNLGEPMKKTALLIASLAVAAGSLTACGGDDKDASSAPSDTPVKEFCAGVQEAGTTLGNSNMDDKSTEEQLAAVKKFADKMIKTGTPSDMPEKARDQWLKAMERIQDLDASDVKDKDANPMSGLESDEMQKYFATACAGSTTE